MRRFLFSAAILAFAASFAPTIVRAQDTSDAAYIAKIATGAPASVVKGATIVQMQQGGSMRVVQTGSNGFTCMLLDPVTPMCGDKNAVAWMHAYLMHSTPPADVGFVYMLAGDDGASNTDPFARAQTSDNHWVKTGPHVMIVGSSVTTMGYPASADADPTKPFVMWANTPYAHLMIPVTTGQ
jgi:hypothetical protein